ncbi:unnamed protein product [Bemisia tabaci]|uniref:Double jelly roll-like domain-containing protein n=1 Tax=Bemisia tabaci TaxID=7038 RepID=A0A9P0AGL3_BEMTA|nr:unnamed protein product [Bemisia tabaci]
MSDILDVISSPSLDESISRIELQTLNPSNPNALNNNDIIHFSMNQADMLPYLPKSYFLISGRLAKSSAEGALSAPSATNRFANGGILHLFNRIELRMNNSLLQSVNEPGKTCLVRLMTTYNDWNIRHLQLMGLDESLGMEDDGSFHNVVIPFKVFFSFGEDFRRVLINPKLEILLTRARTDDNAIYQTAAENYSLKISKIQFRIPFVQVDDVHRLKLLKIIDKDRALPIAFRSWDLYQYPELPASTKHTWSIKTSTQIEKPRYVVVFFQTGRMDDKSKNACKFDHCDLRNIQLYLNNMPYPYESYDQSFSKNNFAIFYHAYCEFSSTYNGLRETSPYLRLKTFKSDAPLFIINCERQKETLKYGPVDVRLEFEANAAFPANTTASCIIIHDTIYQYNPLSGVIKKYEG